MAHIVKDRVKESSTTTGTGPFAVSGAESGFRTFGSVCSVGDTFRCSMIADNGAWQVGVARYSATNEVTFDSVVDSSDGGSPVSFAAGGKDLFIGLTAAVVTWVREKLTANKTLYVATTGNDANPGTVSAPFLTVQKAVTVFSRDYDLNGYSAIVQIADGTYTQGASIPRLVGSGQLIIQGNSGTPANVLIHVTNGNCFTANVQTEVLLKDLRTQTTTGGHHIYSGGGAIVRFSNLNFGPAAWRHIFVSDRGYVQCDGNYVITGGAQSHWSVDQRAQAACNSKSITLTGTPAFSSQFASVTSGGFLSVMSLTFTGSATGSRYFSGPNSFILATGTLDLPGSSAGTTNGGGYVS